MGLSWTADGDCSHEIKRHLLLGRKVMTNLDNMLKSRDVTLPTVYLVKAMVFPVVIYECESWTLEGWAQKTWCFWTVVLEKTLESPLDCKEIQPVHPKGDQSWEFIGRTDDEAETPTISSSVIPFSSCPQSFPASGSMSQLFTSGGQSIGVSASASLLPMNTQDWSPLGWTGWISLQSKGLSRVFSNTTLQKHQFFGPWLSL